MYFTYSRDTHYLNITYKREIVSSDQRMRAKWDMLVCITRISTSHFLFLACVSVNLQDSTEMGICNASVMLGVWIHASGLVNQLLKELGLLLTSQYTERSQDHQLVFEMKGNITASTRSCLFYSFPNGPIRQRYFAFLITEDSKPERELHNQNDVSL